MEMPTDMRRPQVWEVFVAAELELAASSSANVNARDLPAAWLASQWSNTTHHVFRQTANVERTI